MRTRVARVEVAAVVLTAALHPLFADLLELRLPFILAVSAGWAFYVVRRVARAPWLREEWGLSGRNLRPAAGASALVFLAGLVLCAVVGWLRGRLELPVHAIGLVLLYPLWGLVQQFLVQAMFVRNVARALPAPATALLAGLLFCVIHLPYLELSAATALLGVAFAAIYQRWRNVWPLGVVHGWLGVLFYYWVLGRDPWIEMFGKLQAKGP